MKRNVFIISAVAFSLLTSCNRKISEAVENHQMSASQSHSLLTLGDTLQYQRSFGMAIENPCIRMRRIRADDSVEICVTGSRMELLDTGAMTRQRHLKLTADDSLVTAASLNSRSQRVTNSDSFRWLTLPVASIIAAILAALILSLTRIRSRR